MTIILEGGSAESMGYDEYDGQDLYDFYRQEWNKRGVEIDPWRDLDLDEQVVWHALAERVA
jgi:hypothetical protein